MSLHMLCMNDDIQKKSRDTKVLFVCHSWESKAFVPAKQSLSSLLSFVPLFLNRDATADAENDRQR